MVYEKMIFNTNLFYVDLFIKTSKLLRCEKKIYLQVRELYLQVRKKYTTKFKKKPLRNLRKQNRLNSKNKIFPKKIGTRLF